MGDIGICQLSPLYLQHIIHHLNFKTMHNIHLVRVEADFHSDALRIVEDFILDWGTENNWSTILGSHCKEDKSFSESFDEKWVTKDELLNDPNRFNFLIEVNAYYKAAFHKVSNLGSTVLIKSFDWSAASKYCKEQSEILNLSDPTKIDIWSDTYHHGVIDKPGITELYCDGALTFIVLVDMHS